MILVVAYGGEYRGEYWNVHQKQEFRFPMLGVHKTKGKMPGSGYNKIQIVDHAKARTLMWRVEGGGGPGGAVSPD